MLGGPDDQSRSVQDTDGCLLGTPAVGATVSRAELEVEYQRYVTLRVQANEDWKRLAQITTLMAEQFMNDSPYGGDIQALRVTFASATRKTRKAVAQYRAWLIKQQGGTS